MKENSVFEKTLVPHPLQAEHTRRNIPKILNPIFVPTWQDYRPQIFTAAGLDKANFTAELDEINSGLAAEYDIFRHGAEDFDWIAAQREAERIQKEHIEKVLAGDRDSRFTRTRERIYEDYRLHVPIIQAALEKQIEQTRPKVLALVKTILAEISVVTDQMETEELAKAQKWGTPFAPSEPLRLLASAERGFAALVKKIENGSVPPGNPNWTLLRDYLPAGWINNLV